MLALIPPSTPRCQPLRCAGCRARLHTVHGYADVDTALHTLTRGVVACRSCTLALVAVGGDAETLERLAEARRGTPRRTIETLRALEARHIRETLTRCRTVTATAEALGINRTTLSEKLRRLRLAGALT